MRDGGKPGLQAYDRVRALAAPVVAELHAKMRKLPPGSGAFAQGTPGAYDVMLIGGHPAILSVKPVVSPSGLFPQPRGEEIVHISVVRLDGSFVSKLSRSYLFQGARFSRSDDRSEGESAAPFVSPRTGQVVGYFIWRPYAPGSIVMRDMLPVLAATLLLIGAIVFLLLRRIERGAAQLRASEAQAKHLAFHDVLTGLPNRALFDDRMDRALAMSRRQQDQNVALLYLDLDRFKNVNDTLGHPAGDELIRELGRRLAGVVREADTVARLGGDEFAVLQTGVRSQRDTELLCKRILATVSAPFDVIGSQAFVGMSIGVARSGVDGMDRTELTRKADIALYQAKSGGRGRYVTFLEHMDATIQLRQDMEKDLRTALQRADQLKVYYQPQYDAASGLVSGMEALVRWQHPRKGLMCPATFIPIAEESGLIVALGEWVLREACAAAIHWPVETISVNVSAVQLRNDLFAAQALKILRETGLDPARLELEVTETSFLENVEQCKTNLKTLRMAGVRIALDDFGTGYSSFGHLREYKVDRLKIDRSFTASIQNSEEGSAIIRAIVALARSTGLKVTAEGVETIEQSDFLCLIGCDELQGFLMSKAVPLAEIDKLMGVDPTVRIPLNRPRAA
jgi:diguanylate cyclase (GGDEF)-like protein